MAQFKDLSDITKGNAGQLAVNGDVLAKFGDLLIKNTSQVLELMKALQKQKEKDDTLSPEDWERISKEITSGEKVND